MLALISKLPFSGHPNSKPATEHSTTARPFQCERLPSQLLGNPLGQNRSRFDSTVSGLNPGSKSPESARDSYPPHGDDEKSHVAISHPVTVDDSLTILEGRERDAATPAVSLLVKQ
ncbi:uncharacterized protein UV8b_05568 [Ustilaginoidea virens]|uniref:Uncharacterized protein n=1 Tax=Ustilaginoidea virens TaxID=1159556 RepID=A0A8E5HTG0_USTVR|nr:uncharacterized protein UV8b_05568 [Ustilaginoidea virens]QUC21325.1 hypothetical protein UV8b_05568 [Ustilaginoidea virens]